MPDKKNYHTLTGAPPESSLRAPMNKQELIDSVARAGSMAKAEVERTLELTIKTIQDRVNAGDDVTLMGFGTFYLATRKARKGHDPFRDKSIEIPELKIPKFRVGKDFKAKVNSGKKKA